MFLSITKFLHGKNYLMQASYSVTGLMSGTSLDGVDLAFCNLTVDAGKWSYEIIQSTTIPYPDRLRRELTTAMQYSPDKIRRLDEEIGRFYGVILNQFHKNISLEPDIISSHGHTIFHEPSKGITFQAGNGQVIASLTGVKVVNNFRKKDVEHGGQGAPLVPAGDRLLFGEYDICLNIGGIANLSYEYESNRIAYDICPANMLLNYLSGKIGRDFDEDGIIAASGHVDPDLLKRLNGLDYFREEPPKSIGKEWFEMNMKQWLDDSGLTISDKLATAVEHIAFQIGLSLGIISDPLILATGGGVFNKLLRKRIEELSGFSLHLPENKIIKYKESLIFGLLGILRIRNEINCLASVTGASENLCTGDIYLP